jgi:hypothetical protein
MLAKYYNSDKNEGRYTAALRDEMYSQNFEGNPKERRPLGRDLNLNINEGIKQMAM